MNNQAIEQKIQAVVDKIVREYQPEKIILFGSWAWGKPHQDSDLDFFVIKKTHKPRLERECELHGILISRNMPVDLLVYTPDEVKKSINDNHNLFIEDIVRNGKVLYTKPDSTIFFTLPQRVLTILQ